MNIIIVDDDTLVTEALKTILESSGKVTVTATGSDGTDAVRLYKEFKPDILLTDIQMKEMSGLDATKEILSFDNTAKILLLTTFLDDEYIVTALKYGAKGYILKQDYTAIVPALEAVYSGQSVFGTEIISKLPELLNKKHEFDYSDYDINERELEVIKEIADGHSNKEIAADLYLSEGTVRNSDSVTGHSLPYFIISIYENKNLILYIPNSQVLIFYNYINSNGYSQSALLPV